MRIVDERRELPMPKKKNKPLLSHIYHQKSKQKQPSILKEEENKWSWSRILVCVLLIYVGMSFMHGCFAIIDLKAQENVVVTQIRKEEAAKEGLENEVSYLQTEEAVEKIAREDLKMVKPGEILLTRRENAEKENAEAKDSQEAKSKEEKSESTTEETPQPEASGGGVEEETVPAE